MFTRTTLNAFRGACLLTAMMFVGCAEQADPDPTVPTPGGPVETVEQPMVDPNGPNWVAVGGGGRVELLGGQDGEPDVTSGRFVLDATPIFDASSGNGRWIVVGEGKLQALDQNANRLRQVRDILAGEDANFIERGGDEWLAGGNAGQLHRIDNEGEPTLDVALILSGATDVTAAGWNGTSWLVGTADGRSLKVERDLATTSGENTPFAGAAITGIVQNGSGWRIFSPDSWADVTAVGNPGAATEIEAGLQISEVISAAGSIFIGTADGRVGAFNPTNMTNAGWQDLFGGTAVSKLTFNGTDKLIALSTDGRAAQLNTDGTVDTPATSVVAGLPLEGAWFVDGRWLVAAGPIGFVRFVGANLGEVRTITPVLGGADIDDVAVSSDGMLVVGTGGATQFLDSMGNSVGGVENLSSSADALTTDWNGEDFVVGSADGSVEVVSGTGTPQGGAISALGGGAVRFAAWSGEFWLVGGDGGQVQRVRRDGTLADSMPTDIPDMAEARAGKFNGTVWLVGGTSSDNVGVVATVSPAGDLLDTIRIDSFPGAIEAIEYNGLEWIVAGTGGLFQRINAEGTLVGTPTDLLNGYDVVSLAFNGSTLLAGGEFGSARQFTQSLQPLRPALGVLDSQLVSGIEWTSPRGFPDGPCITDSNCFEGPCVGGLNGGVCCDSACTGACESCFQDQTGEPDGTCAPVVAGKRPPVKIHVESPGCMAQAPSTCGTTGFCDGAGACQFHPEGTLCGGEAQCSAVTFTPAAMCVGDGSECPEPTPVSCEPYTVCTVDGGCADTCTDNSECFEGFICENAQCVVEPEEPEMPTETGEEDSGCCAVVRAEPDNNSLPLLLALTFFGIFWARRRR